METEARVPKFARKFDESKEERRTAGGSGGGGGVGETEEQGWRMAGKDEEVPAAVSLLSSVFMVIRAIPLTQE